MRPGRLVRAATASGIAALLLLAGGSSDRALAAGKSKPAAVKPAPFAAALADEYLEFVRRERQKRNADFRSRHFTEKAKRAAGGAAAVPPEDPTVLRITGPDRVALAQARARLTGALEHGARSRLPALAAKTQATFDCWAERVRGRDEASAVAICRERFGALVALLEKAVMPLPVGSRFTRALAREYLAYADDAARAGKDWNTARHFARKGLRAADAKRDDAVPPEPLGRWNLHSTRDVPAFTIFRERLVDAFAAGARERLPDEAARAQARFDCWIERTAARLAAAAVESCRREFLAALTAIEGRGMAQRRQPHKTTIAKTPRAARIPNFARAGLPNGGSTARLTTIAPAAGAWVIHFARDKDELRASERTTIAAVATAARRRAKAIVTVTGHADLSGRPDYNTGLSLRRAANVRLALIRAGIAPDRVRIFAQGDRGAIGRANARRVTVRLR